MQLPFCCLAEAPSFVKPLDRSHYLSLVGFFALRIKPSLTRGQQRCTGFNVKHADTHTDSSIKLIYVCLIVWPLNPHSTVSVNRMQLKCDQWNTAGHPKVQMTDEQITD